MQLDREKAKRNIEAILDKIHSETDLSLLGEYHKLYKKEISLFKRSWAAAWLLMYYDKKEIPAIKKIEKPQGKPAKEPKPVREKNTDNEDKSSVSEIALSENESKKIFISMGKNRRLFPREIISLIMSKTTAAREDIGIIRILSNFSFAQVRDTKANEIIEALNGIKFRGRTLTVNYAKPKGSEE